MLVSYIKRNAFIQMNEMPSQVGAIQAKPNHARQSQNKW